MFKKLKEKITEEVKISPQRFQQLTQSVSDRLQNASTSDENFFSIADDDANTSNASLEAGFTNVSLMSPQESKFRRNSTSSVASDVSFLPRYESYANIYHLQSDLDVSASEMEDNASSSSQLGHLSKEQVYAAFQKTQMRYYKYRGRYTDLAKHYKELERENGKMKSVLVETQDKAIRRVTELKEQCSLEQKAKAHLESALRDEIDEKQMKIQSLQTKIELLQNGSANQNTENFDTLNKYLTDARQEIESLNEKIQELKANAIIFQTKEQEYKTKISGLEKEISMFSEREKENNLSLAQNKMELHNELLSKDNELGKLKDENETLKTNLEVVTLGKVENLQTQNKKLIDKLENLTQKCGAYENELLKMEQFKIELQNSNLMNAELKNRLKESEDKLETVREDAKKSLLALESKIEGKLQKKFEDKESAMKDEFQKKLGEISSNENSLKEVHMRLMEKEEELGKLKGSVEKLREQLGVKSAKYDDLEKNHLELIEEGTGLRSKISNLEREFLRLQNVHQASDLNTARLQSEVANLEEQIENFKKAEEKLQEDAINSNEEENQKILQELEQVLTENKRLLKEIELLQTTIQKHEEDLKEEKKNLEETRLKLCNSEETVTKLGENNRALNEELKVLEKKEEEIQTRLESSVQENLALASKVSSVEEELKRQQRVVDELDRQCNVSKGIEEDLRQQLILREDKIREIEDAKSELSLKLQEGEKEMKKLETTNVKLKEEIARLKENNESVQLKELEDRNLEIQNLKEEIEDLNGELEKIGRKETEQRKNLEEMQKHEDELNQEVNLLKKLLEEASNNLTLKEFELEKHLGCEDIIKKLEEDLTLKINQLQDSLNLKDHQIETLSKKLEEYHDLSEERNNGLAKIFNNFPGQTQNNFQRGKNVEEKLKNFEKSFGSEKEHLAKILVYLKQFEEQFSSTSFERNQLENEKEQLLAEVEDLRNQVGTKRISEQEVIRLKEENARLEEAQKKISQTVLELESRNTQVVSDSNFLSEENNGLITEIETLKLRNEEIESRESELKENLTKLENELKTNINAQVAELERNVSELQHEKQLLKEEIEELKTSPINTHDNYEREIENLRTKIVQYKSLDLTNRSSIEFYENELQKLKNQNEKLNRKLDETLVTLNHCSELSNSTEIEYLKNVLYNYMLGKESLVLARVIAAVCKFDPDQTETVLAKEQQKQTLLGQLGIL